MSSSGRSAREASHPIIAAAQREPALWDRAEHSLEIGTWCWDVIRDEIVWSENLFRLMGCDPGAFKPTSELLFDRVHPVDVERVQRVLDATRAGDRYLAHEYRIVRPDGMIRHLVSSPAGEQLTPAGRGSRRLVMGVVKDVTELRAAERVVALHMAVSNALAEWGAFRPGSRQLLQGIARALDVDAAGLWLPDGDRLAPRVLWSGERLERGAFERELGELEPVRGRGVAGQAWANAEPVVASGRDPDDEPASRPAAALDGISPALAFPAVSDGSVLAVIVLYACEPLDGGERLQSTFATLGRQLGAFLARRPGMLRLSLTARETEVLRLAAEGLSGPGIAAELSLSTATVKTHLANAYAKIGVSGRVAAVAYALREGLIE